MPAVNSSRIYLRKVNAAFAAGVSKGDYVLDAGAGEQPYADLFDHAVYESADFTKVESKTYAPQTYVCDLAQIPVDDGRFDHVVLNQVLEHVPDPIVILTELRRVLKPGGRIICTCPLYYEEHEQPYDFFRYTQFAHQMMFAKSGFEVKSIDWLEGYFGTVSYQLKGIARNLPVWPASDAGFFMRLRHACILYFARSAARLLTGPMARLDVALKYEDKGYPKNYVVIAEAI
ncbi:class I SAM-dependent methyltransferase [Yoonia sp. F2084L]|uniref:class I SAM-dependent methyltransferase n=1 Tax=Yoonia sp. F2084L TaxID=2926419 RepID=UPI001FF1B142|nr:class I SAM-dependent methyltransferase [Yoonia sp. F2084L]MCK0095352.1 class I SAM-dependent methyltransferase [Yoonia sp. F2084L]